MRRRAARNVYKKYNQPEETWLIEPSRGGGLLLGLVYPSSYSVGMSSLGYQLIYRLLAGRRDVLAERLFCEKKIRPVSIESNRPAGDFDILAFSCSFEADYINLIRFLRESSLEPLAGQRDGTGPLILAGGIAVTANPGPLSAIADVLLLGEGEQLLPEVMDCFSEAAGGSREDLLQRLAEIPGVYIPDLHGIPAEGELILRRVPELDTFPTGSAVLSPQAELSNMDLVELARGCRRRCRFCLTGHLTKHYRTRSQESVLAHVDEAAGKIQRVGLIASELTGYPEFESLCEALLKRTLRFSTSSLEIDRLDQNILDLLVRGGQNTLTIAPEFGDQQRRFDLRKRISDKQIFDIAERAGKAGIERLKIYLILGAPGSDESEAETTARFLEQVRRAFFSAPGRGRKEIALSVNPFIPKPHTDWTAEPMIPEGQYKRRVQAIRRAAGQLGGIHFTAASHAAAVLEAALSLGDEKTGRLLVQQVTSGASPRALLRGLLEHGPVDPFSPERPLPLSGWSLRSE